MKKRNAERALRLAMADTPVVLLNGARQTGKTTLARHIAKEHGAQYFTFDDPTSLGLASNDPVGFVQGLSRMAVLDEIQKVPELLPALTVSIDSRPVPGRFLLTSSANVWMQSRYYESLVGRVEVVPLFPFSAGELAGARETFLERVSKGIQWGRRRRPADRQAVIRRLVIGGYPEAQIRKSEERRAAWFMSYLATTLGGDVRDIVKVDALRALPTLLKLLAKSTAGLLNLADMVRATGLPHTTLRRYLALLETVFIVQSLPAWSGNSAQRIVKSPKLHLLDTGLVCHLLGVDGHGLAGDTYLLGRVLETFVVQEIRKQASFGFPQVKLCHYKSASGGEAALLLEWPNGSMVAFEVRASATVRAADFAGLKSLREEFGAALRAGVLIYLGEQVVPFGDGLWCEPISALWSVDAD